MADEVYPVSPNTDTHRKMVFVTDEEGKFRFEFTNLKPRTRFSLRVDTQTPASDKGVVPEPLGVQPREHWLQDRYQELGQAMLRRVEAKLDIPFAWLGEYNELAKELS